MKQRRFTKPWLGWAPLLIGAGVLTSAVLVTTTAVGQGLTIAAGGLVVFFAVLSLLARRGTQSHWSLVVTGLVMTMLPWLVEGFASDRDARPSAVASWLSGAALAIGLSTVVLGAVLSSTSAAIVVLVGLGSFASLIARWSLLASDPTHDYFTLAIVGVLLVLAPTAGAVTGPVSWVAWIGGAATASLGVVGYLRGDALDVAASLERSARTRYRESVRCREMVA